ncbi:MAG: CPBP family intramembrane metalloprotease domain-containing protein [Bacteroidetes bacterium QS_1_63_11]|nr:MAG: CPBP family intramembrane metalloprotease domain-containing protein [Bacteroidetes bacterium QS_1_63_11]
MASPSPAAGGPTLFDPWSRRGRLPLDGPLERASVRRTTLSFLTGLLGLGGAFILFQFILTPIILVAQIAMAEGGVSMEAFRSPLAGVVGLQPVTQWLAELNQQLPLPETVRLMEQSQLELIRNVLESNMRLISNVAMLALVPGICEELLFRGYAQRQFERAVGPVGGILLAGVLFGVYHLRPSQLLPLTALGLYMAYLVWRTGSLLSAMAVHVAHNGLAVVGARYAESHPDYDLQAVENAIMPWYAVLVGFVIVGGVLYVVHTLAPRIRDG